MHNILKTLHFNDLILVNNKIFLFSVLSLDDVLCRYKAVGIRLDSGDLAYLSCESRKFFVAIEKEFGVADFGKMCITASNDLNEETLDALNKQVLILKQFYLSKLYLLIVSDLYNCIQNPKRVCIIEVFNSEEFFVFCLCSK